jgi:PAS domain S-box-containing protein
MLDERYFMLAPDLLCIIDAAGRIVRVNPAFAQYVGQSADAIAECMLRELCHPDDAEGMEWLLSADGGDTPLRQVCRLRAADGVYCSVEWNAARDPADATLLAIGRLTTDLSAAHEQHARFEAALEGVVAGFFILDTEWRYQFINTTGARLVNRTREQLQGRVIWEEFPEAVGTAFYTIYHDVMETRQPRVLHEHYPPLDAWFEVFVFPYIGGISVFFLDITERKRAENELRRKEAAIDASLNGIAIANMAGDLTYVNRAFLDLWGYAEAAHVLGRSATTFWQSPEAARDVIAALHQTGVWMGEMVGVQADGRQIIVQVNASIFRNDAGEPLGMVASFLDLSASKRLQEQFLQAQKMEIVGRLAGGVAHDFNNLLTVMKGNLELSMLQIPPEDPLYQELIQDLMQVENAVDSAASLTQQLLAFSRRQIIAPRVMSLNDAILRVQRMLQRLLGEDIELRTLLADGLPYVRFDPNQCEQIIINLAVNARDAMPKGGKLIIETSAVELDEAYARLHSGVEAGEYVMLAVSDTGIGMDAEVKSHLFEPFFTTKEPGKGTGLGLSMVYGAVSQNGGRIEVYSEPGQGTSVKIYLPQAHNGAIEAQPARRIAVPRGGQTIVLVEDDEGVRLLATRLLEQQGYRVYSFSNGQAAIDTVGTITEQVHLLITDVIMPQMNGRVLAERIQALQPSIRVLFTSGYTANVIVQHGVLKEGVEFLAKPYSINALAQRVRDVLDKS